DDLCRRRHPQTHLAPASRRSINSDFLARPAPLSRNSLCKIKPVFIRVFEHQHPPNQKRNRQLGWDAEQSIVAIDSGNFTRDPTAASMVVISVGIEEEQELFNPIHAQQRLSMAIGDEPQNVAPIGM